MKRILTGALCLVYSTCFSQEDFSFNHGGTEQTNYFSIIPYQSIRGKVIVATVVGGDSLKFIVDTGAPTTISQRLRDKLKLPALTVLPVTDQSGKEDSVEIVSLPAVTLGGVTFNGLPALVASHSFLLECFGVDGYIGSNLFRNSIVQFNHQQKTLILTDQAHRLSLDAEQASEMYVNKRQSSPYISVRIEGKKKGTEQLLFDTGMEGLYDLCLRNWKYFRNKKIFDELGKATGSNSLGFHGTADDALQYKLRLPVLRINGVTLLNASVQTTPDSNSRIGSQVLEAGVATLDYPNSRFYFQPFSEKPVDLSRAGFPIEVVYRDEQLQVGIVWKKELLRTLSPGDQVLSVDEKNYENPDVCMLLTQEPAYRTRQSVTLTTRNREGVVTKTVLVQE